MDQVTAEDVERVSKTLFNASARTVALIAQPKESAEGAK